MFGQKDRSHRLQREAKAIARKCRKRGCEATGWERARLTRVNGELAKSVYATDEDNGNYEGDWE